jgi:hypothetical protein
VREAKTAKVVATKTIVEAAKKPCPSVDLVIKNDVHHVSNVPFGRRATLAFVSPWVAP